MRRLTTAFVIFASLLCANVAGMAQTPAAYTAVVKKDEARFTMPVPARARWRWRMKESRERSREYAFDVKVENEGQEYSFGFYVWKNPNSSEGTGSLSSLLDAGQKDLFVHTPAGLNTIVRPSGVGVKQEKDHVVITVKGRKNVERLFSGRPAEVTFHTEIPGEPPTAQTVPVVYAN